MTHNNADQFFITFIILAIVSPHEEGVGFGAVNFLRNSSPFANVVPIHGNLALHLGEAIIANQPWEKFMWKNYRKLPAHAMCQVYQHWWNMWALKNHQNHSHKVSIFRNTSRSGYFSKPSYELGTIVEKQNWYIELSMENHGCWKPLNSTSCLSQHPLLASIPWMPRSLWTGTSTICTGTWDKGFQDTAKVPKIMEEGIWVWFMENMSIKMKKNWTRGSTYILGGRRKNHKSWKATGSRWVLWKPLWISRETFFSWFPAANSAHGPFSL